MRNVSIVSVGGTPVGGSVCPTAIGAPSGQVRRFVCVGPAEGKASIGPMPCRADVLEVVGGCSSLKTMGSSSGGGEPGGE